VKPRFGYVRQCLGAVPRAWKPKPAIQIIRFHVFFEDSAEGVGMAAQSKRSDTLAT